MRALVFDLDGTLIDSAPDIHAAVNRMLETIGEAALSYDRVLSFIGNGVPVLIERVMGARGLDSARHAELLSLFTRFYSADPATLTTLYPHVRRVLEALRADGARMGICTNKPEAPARAILDAFAIAEFFEVVIGGDTLPVKKPDPAPLYAAVRALGQSAVLYVGDSEVDADCAKRARIAFAIFTEGYRKTGLDALPHDAAFSDFNALPEIVARLIPA